MNNKEWDFIFDFKQKQMYEDKMHFIDMGLLFFFAKSITNKEFMENKEPSLYKDFLYKDIITTIKTFFVETKQMKRLINKLVNAGYIKTQKIFGGVSVALTFKYFNSISPKQFNAPDNQKYFFLLKWSKMSELAFEIGRKCPSFYSYYKSNIKNNNININNNLDTKKVNSISSNKGSGRKGETFFEKLKPFFEKYPRFKVDRATLLPSGFDCQRLMQVMERSKFLQNNERIDFEWLMSHYAKVTTKLESGKFTYDDYYQSTDKKAFCTRNYAPDDPVFKFSNLDDIVI